MNLIAVTCWFYFPLNFATPALFPTLRMLTWQSIPHHHAFCPSPFGRMSGIPNFRLLHRRWSPLAPLPTVFWEECRRSKLRSLPICLRGREWYDRGVSILKRWRSDCSFVELGCNDQVQIRLSVLEDCRRLPRISCLDAGWISPLRN